MLEKYTPDYSREYRIGVRAKYANIKAAGSNGRVWLLKENWSYEEMDTCIYVSQGLYLLDNDGKTVYSAIAGEFSYEDWEWDYTEKLLGFEPQPSTDGCTGRYDGYIKVFGEKIPSRYKYHVTEMTAHRGYPVIYLEAFVDGGLKLYAVDTRMGSAYWAIDLDQNVHSFYSQI